LTYFNEGRNIKTNDIIIALTVKSSANVKPFSRFIFSSSKPAKSHFVKPLL
jgi:hypothetical protein